MSRRCFGAGSNTRSWSSAGNFFKSGNTKRASSHSCWLMGVFSRDRDCCRQGLDYLGQTGGVSTGLSGNRPRGHKWHRAFPLRLEAEAVWAENIAQGLLGMEGSPDLSAPSHDIVAVLHLSGSLTPCLCPGRGSILYPLLSGSHAHYTTLISDGSFQEEPEGQAYLRLCRGTRPQTQGLLCQE